MKEAIPELDRRGLRNFGLTFAGIVAVLFGLLLPWVFGHANPVWPWIVAAIFVLWSLALPKTLRVFYRLWMRFGLLLNAVMSRVILGIVFYLVVLPTGLIFRLRGRDPMRRSFDRNLESYRATSHRVPPEHMERPF